MHFCEGKAELFPFGENVNLVRYIPQSMYTSNDVAYYCNACYQT
jgi:hypothetical protein